MFAHNEDLAASYYGRFFARNLNLQLLQRRPDEWRDMQAERKKKEKEKEQTSARTAASAPPISEAKITTVKQAGNEKVETTKAAKRKRSSHKNKGGGDVIDSLFDSVIGKKVKRAALESGDSEAWQRVARKDDLDAGLKNVLGAIKDAPDREERKKRKRREYD